MATIPKHAEKKFSGVIFDVYQYEQELYDGSTTTFELLKRPWTLQCIPVVGDKILIVKDTQPHRRTYFTFPGGRQNPGETPMDGALREMREETGYVSDDVELFNTYSPSNKIDWDIYMFIARNAIQIEEPQEQAGELVEQFLVSFEELMDIVASEEFMEKEFALDILRMERNGNLEAFKERLFQN